MKGNEMLELNYQQTHWIDKGSIFHSKITLRCRGKEVNFTESCTDLLEFRDGWANGRVSRDSEN